MPISGNTVSEKQPLEIKRNALYNLEEIKVRWKKAALENCPGVPCVVAPPAPSFTCGTSTVLDFDGNAYNTVSIGNQCWTTTNLKVTKYNDGTAIDLDASGGMFGNSSQTWSIKVTGAYTIYENDIINVTRYGFLYNWYAAIDSKKLCPTGWHVPVEDEWKVLGAKLGGPIVAGGKLKSTSTLWINVGVPVPGNNESGFFANPGGFRDAYVGGFNSSGSNAFFWSATGGSGLSASNANGFNLNPGDGYSVPNWSKASGFSVRCLKD
jgi:uncharacterized protein (TIGR02145 family)